MPSYYVTVVALERLSWHKRVHKEHWEGCVGTVEYYRSAGKAVLAQWSTKGALGRLCWHSGVLKEHWEGCAGTMEYYRSTGKAVLA